VSLGTRCPLYHHCTRYSKYWTEASLYPFSVLQVLLVPLPETISPPGFLVLCYSSTAPVISLYSSVYFQKLPIHQDFCTLQLEYCTCHLTLLFSVLPGATCPLEPSTWFPVVKDKHSTNCISMTTEMLIFWEKYMLNPIAWIFISLLHVDGFNIHHE
jgi:hypothetical protein